MEADREKALIDLLNERPNGTAKKPLKNDLDADALKLYHSISSMDSLLRKELPEPTTSGFTENLMQQVLGSKIQTSGSKILRMLLLAVCLILLFTTLVFTLWSENFEVPTRVVFVLEQFYHSMTILSDPKFKQLFLIFEGIILLIAMEKVISGHRSFHKRSPEGT